MKQVRSPRPPATSRLPTITGKAEIAAQEAKVIQYLTMFRDQIRDRLSASAGHEFFEDYFFEKLVTFDATVINQDELSPEEIVKVARAGHPAADRALFRFADKAMVVDRWHEAPMPVREYIRERMRHGEMSPGYPPRVPRTVDHFVRDCAVSYIIDRLTWRLPHIRLYGSRKKGRRSAADLVGSVFGISGEQAKRIHQADQGIAEKLGAFFAAGNFQTFGIESNV